MGRLVNCNLKSKCGVYGVYDFKDNLCYVGYSSGNCSKRHSNHYSNLKNGRHKNPLLQAKYDESDELYMKIIEYFDDAQAAVNLEHKLIHENTDNPHLCNIRTDLGKVVRYSDESKHKMSNSQRGENNGNSKLSRDKVNEIIKRLREGEKQADLALEFGVGQTCIYKIAKNQSWKMVEQRLIGDGTGEPLQDLVFKFEIDEETKNGFIKLRELIGVNGICEMASRM